MRGRDFPFPATVWIMKLEVGLLVAVCILATGATQLRLKRTFRLDYGSLSWQYGYVVCGDLNRNGSENFCFFTGFPRHGSPAPRWEIWECRSFNRHSLVYVDTAPYPFPPGIQTGFFCPFATGDLDNDSLPELWGLLHEQLERSAYRRLLACMESPRPGAYPDSLVWFARVESSDQTPLQNIWTTDLDRDGRKEIFLRHNRLNGNLALCIYENTGDNQYDLVWGCHDVLSYDVAFGDFDFDGKSDFVYFGRPNYVRECVGDNRYDCVFQPDHPPGNNNEIWSGRDVNRNGKPEFWTGAYRYLGMLGYRFYLYYWEANADNSYQWFFVDSIDRCVYDVSNASNCGDVDGDGVEEVMWANGSHITIYDCEQPGILTRVCDLYSGHGSSDYPYLSVTAYDLNQNGYNEIVVGGSDGISIYEIEAIRLLSPNGGEQLHPGDTCRVSWQTFHPPRCDSIGLFLRTDTTWVLDTIATGLMPADTPYAWVVPDIRADSCWLVAIAYNRDLWQWDETDAPLRIGVPGIEEEHPLRVFTTRLDVSPNPARGRLKVKYEVARAGFVELAVFDRTGRRTAVLVSERMEPGRYELAWSRRDDHGRLLPAGIYFLRMEVCGKTFARKAILSE